MIWPYVTLLAILLCILWAFDDMTRRPK